MDDVFTKAVIVTKGGGPLVHGPTAINPAVGRVWSALQALNVVIGLFSSLAVNMPDFARFSKSHKASASQALLLPVIGTLGALSPIFVTSAYKQIWGGKSISFAVHLRENPDTIWQSISGSYLLSSAHSTRDPPNSSPVLPCWSPLLVIKLVSRSYVLQLSLSAILNIITAAGEHCFCSELKTSSYSFLRPLLQLARSLSEMIFLVCLCNFKRTQFLQADTA